MHWMDLTGGRVLITPVHGWGTSALNPGTAQNCLHQVSVQLVPMVPAAPERRPMVLKAVIILSVSLKCSQGCSVVGMGSWERPLGYATTNSGLV